MCVCACVGIAMRETSGTVGGTAAAARERNSDARVERCGPPVCTSGQAFISDREAAAGPRASELQPDCFYCALFSGNLLGRGRERALNGDTVLLLAARQFARELARSRVVAELDGFVALLDERVPTTFSE